MPSRCWRPAGQQEESDLDTTTIGIDLAKRSFELAIADEHYRVRQRLRLSRARFEQFIGNAPASLFVLEACGSAQHWGVSCNHSAIR